MKNRIVKFYRVQDKSGIGLWWASCKLEKHNAINDKLGSLIPSPYRDSFTGSLAWSRGKFYFTEKAIKTEEISKLIHKVLSCRKELHLKEIELSPRHRAIIWHGVSGLQVAIDESLLKE